jgi:hypothetical protein
LPECLTEPKTVADAAGLTQAERLALELWAEGHKVKAVAKQLDLGPKEAYKLLCSGSDKLQRRVTLETKALFKIMRPEYGRDVSPIEDENGRPVTIRARPLTADDLLRSTRGFCDAVCTSTW